MDALARAGEVGWYHSLELAPGYVTDGMFDLRPYVARYGLPARMEGVRALDVGTFDGFWAFEMERRGADVVALDIGDEGQQDWPPRRRPASPAKRGEGFRLAREALDSAVERVECNLYDARPESLGHFDLVFCGSVLTHLRDQLLALERIAELCRGKAIVAEEYDRVTSLMPLSLARYRADAPHAVVFWRPNARLWRQMMRSAGFDRVEERTRFVLRSPRGFGVPHVVLHGSESVTAR